jgi:cell division protein FtsZ
MDKNIKITLVATGFAQSGTFNNMEDEEVTRLLKSLKVEDELDIPSFMRKPMFNDRRYMPSVPQTSKTETKA